MGGLPPRGDRCRPPGWASAWQVGSVSSPRESDPRTGSQKQSWETRQQLDARLSPRFIHCKNEAVSTGQITSLLVLRYVGSPLPLSLSSQGQDCVHRVHWALELGRTRATQLLCRQGALWPRTSWPLSLAWMAGGKQGSEQMPTRYQCFDNTAHTSPRLPPSLVMCGIMIRR